MPKYEVYVSYADGDDSVAERLASRLAAHGLSVFFDRWELTAGHSINQTLSDALLASQFIVFVVASEANRPWMSREMSTLLRSDAYHRLIVVAGGSWDIPTLPGGLATIRVPRLKSKEGLTEAATAILKQVEASGVRTAELKPRMSRSGSLALDYRGHLPAGTHNATLAEVLARFATGSALREQVGSQLKDLFDRARSAEGEYALMGGNFLSDRRDAADVDVVVFIRQGKSETAAKKAVSTLAAGADRLVTTRIAGADAQANEFWASFLGNQLLGAPRGVLRVAIEDTSSERQNG